MLIISYPTFGLSWMQKPFGELHGIKLSPGDKSGVVFIVFIVGENNFIALNFFTFTLHILESYT